MADDAALGWHHHEHLGVADRRRADAAAHRFRRSIRVDRPPHLVVARQIELLSALSTHHQLDAPDPANGESSAIRACWLRPAGRRPRAGAALQLAKPVDHDVHPRWRRYPLAGQHLKPSSVAGDVVVHHAGHRPHFMPPLEEQLGFPGAERRCGADGHRHHLVAVAKEQFASGSRTRWTPGCARTGGWLRRPASAPRPDG